METKKKQLEKLKFYDTKRNSFDALSSVYKNYSMKKG